MRGTRLLSGEPALQLLRLTTKLLELPREEISLPYLFALLQWEADLYKVDLNG